jgi:hypothetical protein
VGAYSIDPLATPGQTDSGTLVVLYDLVDSNFNDLEQNLELTAPVSVTVTAVPEPASVALLLCSLLIGVIFVRERRRRSA